MSKNTKIIILRGNSGCGKTTTARLLQKKIGHGTMLISQDVIRREMLYVKDGPDCEAVKLLIHLVAYGKENCDTIILEGILHSGWYKDLFKYVADSFGEQIFAYYFDVSFEETLRRHEMKPNSHEFGEVEMRRWWNQDDYLEDIEEVTLPEEMNQDEILEMIYRELE